MDENKQIKKLADRLGDYIWRHYVKPRLARSVSFYRAEVVSAASDGKITVKRPPGDTALALPYVGSAASLAAGGQCVVLVLGDASNAVVLGDGTLSNL